MSTLFEIRRRNRGSEPMSRVYPKNYSPGVGALDTDIISPRGVALGAGADKDSAVLAQGSNFLGFLTRKVTVGGPTLTEIAIPTDPLALPFKAGEEVSLEKADEVEAEGTDYLLTSGTGLLDVSTAVGAKISFKDGRFYVAQAADVAYYTVSANLTGTADVVNAGAVRMLFEIAT